MIFVVWYLSLFVCDLSLPLDEKTLDEVVELSPDLEPEIDKAQDWSLNKNWANKYVNARRQNKSAG